MKRLLAFLLFLISGSAIHADGLSNDGGYFGFGTGQTITITGNVSAPAWTTNGLYLNKAAATYTDTTSTGTVASEPMGAIGGDTLNATNVITVTNLSELTISPPIAGTNVTATNIFGLRLIGSGNLGMTGGNILNTGNSGGFQISTGNASATNPVFVPNKASTTTGIGAQAAGNVSVITGGAENMRFNATTQQFISLPTTGTNADFLCMSAAGVILIQSSACTISSARFKENVLPWVEDALGQIERLPVVSFNLKSRKNRDPNALATQVGLLAEDVARFAPECTIYEPDMKTPKSYRQECLIAVLVASVQQQQHEIDALKRSHWRIR